MNIRILPALAATCALALVGPAYAQHGNSTQPHAPKAPTPHVQGGSTATHGGGSQTHGGASVHGGGTTAHGSASTHGGGSHATTTHGPSSHAATTTKGGSHATTTTKPSSATKSASTTPLPTSTTTTTAGTELTPIQQKLLKNTNLSTKLQSRLPNGVTVQDASVGFRNLGQFVAAVNVSNNLGIPFADLKAKMLGDTAHLTTTTADDSPMSLGQAIHALRPTVDADAEATTAVRQADVTITASTPTTTTKATTTSTPTKTTPTSIPTKRK